MSDIVIKGIEMPKKCLGSLTGVGDCFVVDKCKTFQNTDLDTKYKIAWDDRLPNCPLVELPPHGRLIDADALSQNTTMIERNIERDGLLFKQYDTVVFVDEIENAPTILEASEVTE